MGGRPLGLMQCPLAFLSAGFHRLTRPSAFVNLQLRKGLNWMQMALVPVNAVIVDL